MWFEFAAEGTALDLCDNGVTATDSERQELRRCDFDRVHHFNDFLLQECAELEFQNQTHPQPIGADPQKIGVQIAEARQFRCKYAQ